jgi:predicted molibdopterin-dependent oxidoreductase YjgC
MYIILPKFSGSHGTIMPAKAKKRQYARLTQPMVRADGGLRPATWDEALDRAAGGLRDIVKRHGPSAFGLFSCSKSTNEMNFTAQKFARIVIGSNNIDSCNRT